MAAYQNEQQLRQKLDGAFNALEAYSGIGPHTPTYYVQHHRSIVIHKRDAQVLEFSYMGTEFVIMKETRPIIGYGYLKTYRKEVDKNNYPRIKCVFIPELLIRSDAIGNLSFNGVNSTVLDKGYFDAVYTYLSNHETSSDIE